MSARTATAAGRRRTISAARRCEKEFGGKIETPFLENVPEGPDAERAIERTGPLRLRADLHHLVRFHGPDASRSREKFPNVKFEHATGFKAAAERRDLQFALL